ncbi:cyclin-like protein interacting with PHO85, partial [Dimargaris xerosporica]
MSALNIARTPTKDLVEVLAHYFQVITTENDVSKPSSPYHKDYTLHRLFSRQDAAHSSHPPPLTPFHSSGVPSIDLLSYLNRIRRYCPCPNECFVSLLIYFRRITDKCRANRTAFSVDPFSVHRLIIAGITTSSKFFSDVFYTNVRYARVGGIHVNELNMLELEFLKLIGFELYVSPEELQETVDLVVCQGLPNRYATYPVPQSRIPTPPSPASAHPGSPDPSSLLLARGARQFTGAPTLVIQSQAGKLPNIIPSALVTPVTPSAHHGMAAPECPPGFAKPSVEASLIHSTTTTSHPTPTPPRTPPAVEGPSNYLLRKLHHDQQQLAGKYALPTESAISPSSMTSIPAGGYVPYQPTAVDPHHRYRSGSSLSTMINTLMDPHQVPAHPNTASPLHHQDPAAMYPNTCSATAHHS